MTFVVGPVSVRSPASSANLGPGFDALGLALTLHDHITAAVVDSGVRVVVDGEGAGSVPLDADNLVVGAMRSAFYVMGVAAPGLRVTCRNAIPHGRGLGSSAAAIVGGIVLARGLVDHGVERLDDKAVLQLAVDLEGHPDNVAAALLGGLTIAWMDGSVAAAQRLDTGAEVTAFVPSNPLSTEKARRLLPETIAHADGAFNAGRAALLVAALTGAPEHLMAATEDRIHQSYRAEEMPESYALMQQLRSDGVPALISGAGPTVLAFTRGVADRAPAGWTVHELGVEPDGAHVVAG